MLGSLLDFFFSLKMVDVLNMFLFFLAFSINMNIL